MSFETIIGLEVHAQLKTKTKIFCGCSTEFSRLPNHQVCPVCMGLPGALPVLNREAVQLAIRTALALNCRIHPISIFARKNYFYPDLPKGYQISQYEEPLATSGFLEIPNSGKIGITRIHMEEDAGKNVHDESGKGGESRVDYNRSGIPLAEIVSEPDIRSPDQAADYLRELRLILRTLGVCDGNMEEGSFRCDANVSIRPAGSSELGIKVELKNMNSFRHVEKALAFEVERQKALLYSGQAIQQETRLWDVAKQATLSMRTKEEAHDYRYFPEPDLLPLRISAKWVGEIRSALPELPSAIRGRFEHDYGLARYDVNIITQSPILAAYFEKAHRIYPKPKPIANWIITEILRETEPDAVDTFHLSPEHLAGLLKAIESGVINGKIAKDIFRKVLETGESPEAIINREGLQQVTDTASIEPLIDTLITSHPKEAALLRDGKVRVMAFFVGEVMKQTKGKANPQLVRNLIQKKLGLP